MTRLASYFNELCLDTGYNLVKGDCHIRFCLRSVHTIRFCLQFDANAKNGFYTTHSLHLTQHPIDTMLQFDTNAHVYSSVNEALHCSEGESDIASKWVIGNLI